MHLYRRNLLLCACNTISHKAIRDKVCMQHAVVATPYFGLSKALNSTAFFHNSVRAIIVKIQDSGLQQQPIDLNQSNVTQT